jgi:hypothetical protein
MGLFLLVAGGLTCAFFLYVLVQLERDLRPAKRNEGSGSGAGLQGDVRRSPLQHADLMNRKVQMILRKAVESGRAKQATRNGIMSGAIPYLEAVTPIGFVVAPATKSSQLGHNSHPSKQIV